MHNVATIYHTSEEWQQAILKNPSKIEDFIRECFLNPDYYYLLKRFYSHGLWGELLLKHPQLKEYCNEDLQRSECLPDYMYSHPDEITEEALKNLMGYDLEDFIMRCPEHILDCPVENLTAAQVVKLLIVHPEFVEQLEFAEFLDETKWDELLRARPDFFALCPADRIPYRILLDRLSSEPEVWKSIDKEKLASGTWARVLETHPEYVVDCSLETLDDYDYGTLICLHPEWYRQENRRKLDGLTDYFWAETGLFASPLFRNEHRWLSFGHQEWNVVFQNMADKGIIPETHCSYLAGLARSDLHDVGPAAKPQNYSKSVLKGYVLAGHEKQRGMAMIVNGCLKYHEFWKLEYLFQMDENLVASQFDSFRKLRILCVYAPFPLVCQLLPMVDPSIIREAYCHGNTILHYTFLRDPFGDDPEANFIRKLLRDMGALNTPNDCGHTLEKLHKFMKKYYKRIEP